MCFFLQSQQIFTTYYFQSSFHRVHQNSPNCTFGILRCLSILFSSSLEDAIRRFGTKKESNFQSSFHRAFSYFDFLHLRLQSLSILFSSSLGKSKQDPRKAPYFQSSFHRVPALLKVRRYVYVNLSILFSSSRSRSYTIERRGDYLSILFSSSLYSCRFK